jgi:histidyl-tRNA synthetase
MKTDKKSFKDIATSAHLVTGHEIGIFYGFTPIDTPSITPADTTAARKISAGETIIDSDSHEGGAWVKLEEKIALLRLHEEYNLIREPQPIMISTTEPFKNDRTKISPKESHHSFDILGTNKSIAEALLIKTAFALLDQSGISDLHLEINSMGDKESASRFGKELTSFYRHNLGFLPAACKEKFKDDPFSLLGCQHEKCKELSLDCPKSINFLSEESSERFKEILEFIEILGIPYEINNNLVANRDYCSETVFEIRTKDPKDHPLAIGIRYDTLSKKLGNRKEIPAASVSVAYPTSARYPISKIRMAKINHPKICFMQLGYEGKLKALAVIETLRLAGIAVSHSLARDKMAGQVSFSERSESTYVIIMGKREAMEDSVIVRNNATRVQETVPIKDLAKHLKKHRIG